MALWLASGATLLVVRAAAEARRLDDANSTDDEGGDDNTTYFGMTGDEAQGVVAVVGIGAGLLILIFGAAVLCCCCRGKPGFATRARCGGWSLAGMAGMLAVVGVLIATACVSQIVDPVIATGYTAALALSLPLLFAFWKVGLSRLLGVSTEAAFRLHGAFGAIFLVFGTVHGGYAISVNGSDVVNVAEYLVGLVAGILLWAGVLPLVPRLLCPRLFAYDLFKVLHFVAFAGYALAFVHMILLGALPVIVLNAVALGCYVLQKVYVACTSKRVQVVSVTALDDGGLRHVVLELDAPGFQYTAGQWAHLKVVSVSPVPHPFTLVPAQAEGRVRIIAKVSGRFTAALFAKGDKIKSVRLMGPYGNPPLPAALSWARGVVFVVGGVGVTPALALLQSVAVGGLPVKLLWSLRSIGLLHTCAPMLDKNLQPQHRRVCVTGGVETNGVLPLDATTSRIDVSRWLGEVSEELRDTAGGPLFLFVCGPPALAKAARAGAAAAAKSYAVSWHVHEELFDFLGN